MEISKSFDSLTDNHSDFLRRKRFCSFSDVAVQLSKLHILHENIDLLSELCDIVDLDQIRMSHYFQNLELCSQELELLCI